MSDSSDSESSSVSDGSTGSSLSNLSEEIEVLRQLTSMEKIIEVEESETKPDGDADIDILPYINLLFQVDGLNENQSTSSSDGFNSIIGSPSYCFTDSSLPISNPESPEATSPGEDLEEGEYPPSPHTSHYESDSDIISLNVSHQSISSSDSAMSTSPDKNDENKKTQNVSEPSTSRQEISKLCCSLDKLDPDVISLNVSPQTISPDSVMSMDESLSKKQRKQIKNTNISELTTLPQDISEQDQCSKEDSGPDLDVLSLSCSSLSSLSSRSDSYLDE